MQNVSISLLRAKLTPFTPNDSHSWLSTKVILNLSAKQLSKQTLHLLDTWLNAELVGQLCAANLMDSYGSVSSTTQGPFASRAVEAVVQQRDMHNALQQAGDDDPYGELQSSGLPVQQ